jgi:hypothetical protein
MISDHSRGPGDVHHGGTVDREIILLAACSQHCTGISRALEGPVILGHAMCAPSLCRYQNASQKAALPPRLTDD